MAGVNIRDVSVISRNVLAFLVYGMPALIVAFAVLMGAESLAHGAADATAARVLWWAAMSCLMGLAVDMLLLVIVLGVESLSRRSGSPDVDDS